MFDYEKAVQHWVNRLSFQLRAEATRRLQAAGFDLSAEEWAMMMVLWMEGQLSVGELAKRTLRDRTTVTRVLDRLASKGFIHRSGIDGDRRTVIVYATEAGKDIRDDVLAALAPLLWGLTEGIAPNDVDVTLRTLRTMSQRLEGMFTHLPTKQINQ